MKRARRTFSTEFKRRVVEEFLGGHASQARLCRNDPVARQFADDLFAALDGTVRTSSAAENVNSILRA